MEIAKLLENLFVSFNYSKSISVSERKNLVKFDLNVDKHKVCVVNPH